MRWRTAWHLAIAETRRSRGMLLFCVLSVAIGVMALTAIRTVTDNVTAGIMGQARQVLGGDLVLKASEPLSSKVAQTLTQDLLQRGARIASNTQFYSMLALTQRAERTVGPQTQLVNVRAVGDGFPFYGEVETVPPKQWERLADTPGVLVDPSVMHALALHPGDPVKLGELNAVVLGAITKRAGSITSEFSLAPSLYVHERHLPATQLIKTGSRIRYESVFALPAGTSAEDWKESRWNAATDANLRIQTSREAASNVQRFLSRLSKFLTVVGMVTLFLGALGIGSALHTFMASRLDHAAVLRCLGARSRDLFAIYLLVALLVALSGSMVGVGVGALIPAALAAGLSSLSAGLLFVDLPTGVSLPAMGQGLLAGLATALGFTLTPVWRTAAVSPLRVLGRNTAGLQGARSSAQYAGLVGVAVLTLIAFVLTVSQTDSWQTGLAFTASIAGALGALFVLSRLIVLLARRWGTRLRSFHLRQGLANLQRPGNQTGAVVVAVGMGFLLLSSILTMQASLEKLLAVETSSELPNLFLIDVQPDQRVSVEQLLKEHQASATHLSPMVSARIASVNGEPIDKSRGERNEVAREWSDRMRTREYFISYRDHLLDSEELIEGKFWSGRPAQQEASLDMELAENLEVKLGDELTLSVEGLPLTARVTSIRTVHWEKMRENVLILLSPGEIDQAPHQFVATARIAEQADRFALQSAVVAKHPNVTVVDVSQAAQTVLLIIDKVSTIFRVLGFVAVGMGAVILTGAIAAGRFARRREAMLFKVLGASRSDLQRILAAEYASLAVLGTLAGWTLFEILARIGVPALFDTPVHMPYRALVAVALLGVAFNTAMGLLVSRQVSAQRALDVLRE